MKFILSGLVVLALLIRDQSRDQNGITSFLTADSISTSVDGLYDAAGVLDGYKARIFTPICEIDKCYEVTIEFYWDVIGRFQRFDTLTGSPLTKLDHIPFETMDYAKLAEILEDSNSPLARYEKDELVRDTRLSEIDGVTGATIREIKQSVIEGAVYSCHTLWHIAHGSVQDSLNLATSRALNPELVKKLAGTNDQAINYFLIASLTEDQWKSSLHVMLETIPDSRGYYAKNALDKMPRFLFADTTVQDFFGRYFGELNYYAQVALLKKLDAPLRSVYLDSALSRSLTDRGSYRNELIQQLISTEPD